MPPTAAAPFGHPPDSTGLGCCDCWGFWYGTALPARCEGESSSSSRGTHAQGVWGALPSAGAVCATGCLFADRSQRCVLSRDKRKKRWGALDMHVLKTERVIGEARLPVGSFGLSVHLRWGTIVLRGDAPASGDIPAHQTGRGVRTMGLSTVHAARGYGVRPPAVLPLLWIYSRRRGWHEGMVVGGVRDRPRRWVLDRRNDGGRGPGR